MKHEHLPLTDAELADALTVLDGINGDVNKWPVAIRALFDLREARRLLGLAHLCDGCDGCNAIDVYVRAWYRL